MPFFVVAILLVTPIVVGAGLGLWDSLVEVMGRRQKREREQLQREVNDLCAAWRELAERCAWLRDLAADSLEEAAASYDGDGMSRKAESLRRRAAALREERELLVQREGGTAHLHIDRPGAAWPANAKHVWDKNWYVARPRPATTATTTRETPARAGV